MIQNPTLPLGYSPVPKGCLANVVTFLEMRERSRRDPSRQADARFFFAPFLPDIVVYRTLYRAIGGDFLWASRLVMADEALAAILSNPAVEIYALLQNKQTIGLAELDFRQDGECELAYFGVVPGAMGQGAGRFLMESALKQAWSKPIERLWVHTCTLDHPAALGFYVRSGFRPYKFEVEVLRDPRLAGHYRLDAAPHVPLLD